MSRTIYGKERTAQEHKIAELKLACSAAIIGGIDVETTQGTEHFSLTSEDQINVQNLAIQAASGAPGLLYHADGKLCRIFSPGEINELTQAAVAFVTYHTTYYNHLKAWVERAADGDEIARITYGAALPEDLEKSMATLLGGGTSD